ncbi:MAG: phosphatase [Crocinitomicaceae bacterium]|nr:phosphatase [Crocinitomicaceae bacterium]|tara:strand:- start:4041 stop:4499 length:459 start_codon:yes stop_codon:yes gene_type:complete
MSLNYVDGDIIKMGKERTIDVLIHGANCWHKMGAGLALKVKRNWPEAYEQDLLTPRGDKSKLGGFSWVKTQSGLIIVNAYTQYRYDRYNTVADLDAISNSFYGIAQFFGGHNLHFAFPLIGAGLAGGDFSEIAPIISQHINSEKHSCVRFKK